LRCPGAADAPRARGRPADAPAGRGQDAAPGAAAGRAGSPGWRLRRSAERAPLTMDVLRRRADDVLARSRDVRIQ